MGDTLAGLIIIAILFTAPFIVWGATVAQYRGRPPIYGVILGLLFGPIGVALAWLLPPNEDVVWARQLRREWEREQARKSIKPAA